MRANNRLVWITPRQYYESSIKQKKRELNNQMVSLRKCDDDVLRAVIFNDLKTIQAEIDTLDQQYTIEKGKIFVVSEKQVIDRLSKLAQGDIHNLTYRRSLIHIFVNKIFLYDDRFTITFNTGDEPVTITDVLLDSIEKALGNESFCFSEELGHHANPQCICTGGFVMATRTGIEEGGLGEAKVADSPVDCPLARGRFHPYSTAAGTAVGGYG